MFSFFKTKPKQITGESGFTLVEMVVVLAIIMIITGIVLANFSQFRDKSSLDLIAQEVAITVRQAQVFGAGTRAGSTGAADFPSYGISFTKASPNNNKFYLFADVDKDHIYDAPGESREEFLFRSAVAIADLQDCSGASLAGNNLDVYFERPEIDAKFYSGGGNLVSPTPSCVKIKISKGLGGGESDRFVIIYGTGHIYASRI